MGLISHAHTLCLFFKTKSRFEIPPKKKHLGLGLGVLVPSTMLPKRGLTLEELSWVLTFNVDAGSAGSPYVTAPSSPCAASPYTTAPSSPAWPALPAMPLMPETTDNTKGTKATKASARQQQLARSRVYAALCRAKKEEHVRGLEARVAEIEKVNAVLRAQVEDELRENKRLKAGRLSDFGEFGVFID